MTVTASIPTLPWQRFLVLSFFLKIGTHKIQLEKQHHKSVGQNAPKRSKKLQNALWPRNRQAETNKRVVCALSHGVATGEFRVLVA
jgi:hypothetical protein